MLKNCNITTYRFELKHRILQTAMSLFKKQGIKSVKMDDISAALGISKRTLYEIYNNKEDLLLEGVKDDHERSLQELMAFAEEGGHNEIEIVMKFVQMRMKDLNGINPLFFSEMHRYRRVVDFLQEQHEHQSLKSLEFIREGVRHGYFLPELNYDIVVSMGEAVMNHVMGTKLYERYPIREIFKNYVSVLIRGYCTEKGVQELDKLFMS